MIFDLVVSGRLVLENEVLYGEIGVKDEKIQAISIGKGQLSGRKRLDFGQCYVFPGMIDAHVHCFSNPDEGFISTTSSAAVGGITTILDMPYDIPQPINHVDQFNAKVIRLEQEALVDIGLWATIAKTEGTEQILPLAEAGAMAFKMSTFETDPYRFPKISDFEILKAMELIRQTGLRAAFHAENDEIINDMIETFTQANHTYPRAHMETRPPVTETSAVLKLMEFAHWTGVKLHIVHVSHPRTVDLIQIYRKMNVDVTSETCYPYLLLDVNSLDSLGPKAKNNPPLRFPEDVEGLWKHLKAGQIDLITSDHAPWGADRKEIGNDNIFLAASGMAGLEIMVPLLFDYAVIKGEIGVVQFAKWMAQHPAEVYQISGKGKIAIGYDADFTIIDEDQTWVIDESQFRSHSKQTPFHGYEVQAKVVQTIVRGTSVYDGDQLLVKPGFGKFIAGSAAN